MTKRPCPHCQTINPTENRYCGQCGQALLRQTIVMPSDENEPYRIEAGVRPAAPMHDATIGHALATATVALAAELVFVHAERRFLKGRHIGSDHMRQLRRGALTTLVGSAMLFAQQHFAGRPGGAP